MIDSALSGGLAADPFGSSCSVSALRSAEPPGRTCRPTGEPSSPFSRVVGLAGPVEFLRRIATGISYGGEVDPILLQGASGRGKTLLAQEFASAVGLPLITIMCGREISPVALAERLAAQADPVVWFLDEVHSLPKRSMETLFIAIDQAMIPAVRGGSLDRMNPPVPIARHVWVAASNLPGGILRALRTRLVTVSVGEYSQGELEEIARRQAEGLDLFLEPAALSLVARACGGSPRTLGHLLKAIQVTTIGLRWERDAAELDITLGVDVVAEVVGLMGLDQVGLDATSRSLLSAIRRQPAGALSAEALSVISGLDLGFVREQLAGLRARGLVEASPGRGWSLVADPSR